MNGPIDFFLKNANKQHWFIRVVFRDSGPRADALVVDSTARIAVLLRDCGGDALQRGRPEAGSLVHYRLEQDSTGAHMVDGEAWTLPNRWISDFSE